MGKTLGILYTCLRTDENALIAAAHRQGVKPLLISTNKLVFDLQKANSNLPQAEVILERAIDHFIALNCLLLFQKLGCTTVNTYEVARICGDKLLTSLALVEKGLPTPLTQLAFNATSALAAMDDMGYPVMLKPLTGDKGVMVTKINDHTAGQIAAQFKKRLPEYDSSIYYFQRFIDNRPGRDIRAFVVGDQVVRAVYLIANQVTHSGSIRYTVIDCPLTTELERLALAAAHAVGGGVLAVDIIEDGEGYQVIEVDYTVEMSCVGLEDQLAPYIIDYALSRV